MNQIIQSLFDRKSVRVFEDKPISAEDKRLILESAVQAPTAGNQQLYTILDITDQSIKDKLVDSCDHQPFIGKAPMVLVFCADVQKWVDAFEEAGSEPRRPGAGDLLLAIEDTMIAAQNAVVAAESLGIGSCYIGDILENKEFHQDLFDLPRYVLPIGMLVLGYPTHQQKERPKPQRCALEDVVQENRYRRRNGEELRRMFDHRVGQQGFDQWMLAFCNRKYNSDFSREMSRSAAAYVEEWLGK